MMIKAWNKTTGVGLDSKRYILIRLSKSLQMIGFGDERHGIFKVDRLNIR